MVILYPAGPAGQPVGARNVIGAAPVGLPTGRRADASIAPEPEQQCEERETHLVDQRQGIRQDEVQHGQEREKREERREAQVQSLEQPRQDPHAASI